MTGYPDWPDLFRWLTILKARVEQLPSISAEQILTGTLDPSLIPPIPWDCVLKAGSSLEDLETRSASVLSSGTLPDARMPALSGDVSSVAGDTVTTLATVNLSPGTFGSGAAISVVTVNGKGLVTDVTEQPLGSGALTSADDTNVTVTLTGSPAVALLRDVLLTLGWSGTLAAARLNDDVVQAVTDDTNVTGSIAAQTLTLGWTGALAVARGGTGTATAVAIPAVYGSGRLTAQVAAVASVATFTVGGVDASFDVAANVNVTTATTHAFAVSVDYTDETNTARTAVLSFLLVAGGTLVTSIANVNGAVPYMGLSQRLRCKAATAITVKTTGVFTSVVYNVEATITRFA